MNDELDELDELRDKVDRTWRNKKRRRNLTIGAAVIVALSLAAWYANRNPGPVPYLWNPSPASAPVSST